ncbi:hypothetical protein [Rhizobacter fulvus]
MRAIQQGFGPDLRRAAFKVSRLVGACRQGGAQSESNGRLIRCDAEKKRKLEQAMNACEGISDFRFLGRVFESSEPGDDSVVASVQWTNGDVWYVWLASTTVSVARDKERFARLCLLALTNEARLVVLRDSHLDQIDESDLARVREVWRRRRMCMSDRAVVTNDDTLAEDVSSQVHRMLSRAALSQDSFATA